NDELRLNEYLFSLNSSTRYNPRIRPVPASTNRLIVHTRLGIKRLFEMDENNHRVVLFAVFFQKWTDSFLTWDPKNFGGIEYTYVDYSKIWTPNLKLITNFDDKNPSDKSFDEIYENFPVKLYSNGSVQFTPAVHLTSECLLNYGKFPLDMQACSFIFQMPYTGDQIELTMNVYYTDDGTKKYQHIWDIEDFNTNVTNERGIKSSALLQILFKRKYRSYLYTLPSYFVYILTLLMFMLPQRSNQRIMIGSTCLIISCLLSYLMSNTVPNHEISAWPLLGKLFLFNIVLLTFSIMFSAFVINISGGNHTKNVPSWLRKLTLNVLAKVFCIQAVAYTVLNSYSFRVHDEEVIAVHEHINSQIVGSIDESSLLRRRNNEENKQQNLVSDQNQTEQTHDKSLVKYLKVIYDNIDQIRYKIQIETYNICKDNEWLLHCNYEHIEYI
ncbi:neuronal acetylcholine receptor subunit alpha-5, partial [Brachionus plicatilis]